MFQQTPYNMKLAQVIGFYLVLVLVLSLVGGYFAPQMNVKEVADGSMIGFVAGAVLSAALYYQFGRKIVLAVV